MPGPSIFRLKAGSADAPVSCSKLLPGFALSFDRTLGTFVGASPLGGKLGMLVNLGGVSVLGDAEAGPLVGEPKVGFGPDNSSEPFLGPVLFPKAAPPFKPELGVSPAESKLGIETSIFISESLASIF